MTDEGEAGTVKVEHWRLEKLYSCSPEEAETIALPIPIGSLLASFQCTGGHKHYTVMLCHSEGLLDEADLPRVLGTFGVTVGRRED